MKKILLIVAAMAAVALQSQAALQLKEASGWLESCWMEFTGMQNTYSSYAAYISADNGNTWNQLDGELVRSYGSYGRVDAVGISAGSYMLKVVPISSGAEVTADAVTSGALTVAAHDRAGFAHTGTYATTGVGAYNNDGTLKQGAKVFYVTAQTAKTISTSVRTSSNGAMTTYTGMQAIIDGYQKGYDTTPLCFRLIGKITTADMDGLSSSGEGLQIKGRNADSELNITIEGIGNDAMIQGFGFLIRNAKSVELRNFGVATLIDDDISLDTDNDHIWLHHLDLFYGPNKGGDQKKGDGALDIKADSKHVTVSYCHFWDTGKSSMCGMTSESGPNYITYHHNWFDHSDSRHARIRTMSVHIYNNYFDGVAKYCVGATSGGSVFVENNYFRNCQKPMLISKQGTDVHMGVGTSDETKGTFSGEAGGIIKSFGNIYTGAYTLVTYQQNTTHFDCYEASSRSQQVPSGVSTLLGGNTYDNFDTNASLMYTYTPDAAAQVPAVVTGNLGAGRCQHGDFTFTFTDADDTDSDVNNALRATVDNYTSSLVGIIGTGQASVTPGTDPEDPGTDPENPGTDPTDPTPSAGGYESWFTSNGASNTAFITVSGNMSNSKGTATTTLLNGNDTTMQWCLKMESSTSVSFTAPSACTLKVVFSSTVKGQDLKLDGTTFTGTDRVLTTDIAAGQHTLTKATESYVFYIALLNVVTEQTLTLAATNGSNYFATFSSDKAVEFKDEATTVYTVNVSGSSLVLTEVESKKVPANTGVLIKSSTTTATYDLTSSAAALGDNMLVPGTGATFTEEGKYYKLSYADAAHTPSTLGFYWGADNGAAFAGSKGKAYLHTPADFSFSTTTGAPAHFLLDAEADEATAVENVEAADVVKFIENGQVLIKKNGRVYNAMGQIVR